MEAIIFIGIQGSGKSTFYKKYYFNSHLRISLDLLNTRNKEKHLLEYCLQFQQRVVIDNTNPTKQERAVYIEKLKARKFKIIGMYFTIEPEEALKRNNQRESKERIAEVGIFATLKRMELPSLDEGFDELYEIHVQENQFQIKPYLKNYEV